MAANPTHRGPLVANPNRIRLAMLGMVDGNGHPYSWSAIINGDYDAAVMADCGFPVIPQYLGAEPRENLGIAGVKVTHVWCDEPGDADKVAAAACIPNVVEKPEDVIGQVDAVVIPTDRGWEHVDRVRPFVEAGLPVFVDKPLVDSEPALRQFVAWRAEGKPFLSSSCMRYSREYADCRRRLAEVGELRLITMTMAKTWERYGIHGLEGVYPLLEPGGWLSVANSGTPDANIVHARHACGAEIVLATIADLYGAFGCVNLYGTKGWLGAQFKDTFSAFKAQLVAFVEYLRTGGEPFAFDETVELMKIIIAGIRSRDEAGRTVNLSEITL
ncbi:MAG: Gfo/Idh/MocA family oxidoreductase [Phycisphaerae bacterium]|nr:Gfo/Idh/MocA family oxidoreductase [Phycisphaerae bacterium]